MNDTTRRMYNKMVKDFAVTVDDEEVLAWNQGTKNDLLDLITCSPWLLAPKGDPYGGKFDMLAMDVAARSQPMLVFAHHRSVVEAAARVAELSGARAGFVHGGNKAQGGQIIKDFKAGRLDVLVGSLELLAEGLTFTEADTVIFVEKSFKNYRNEQAWQRVHRMGQTRAVTIKDYVTPASVDAKKRKRLATKADRSQRVMTAAEFKALL